MKIFLRVISVTVLTVFLALAMIPAGATVTNPYTPVANGCITGVDMQSYGELYGGIDLYKSVVTSRIQGLETRDAIPYEVYGAIGDGNTRMFVYSVGSSDDKNYAMTTVKSIVENFERDNPAWDAVVAINGDFFDIETAQTPDRGEPEGAMIQMGKVYKGFDIGALGRGLVGTTEDGEMVYHTNGKVYDDRGYGVALEESEYGSLEILGEHRTNAIAKYDIGWGSNVEAGKFKFGGPDAAPNMVGYTVCFVKCDTYRRSHVGINGIEIGTKGYFVEGEITEIRQGCDPEEVPEGYVAIGVPGFDMENYPLLTVGTYIRCQSVLKGDWADVTNAVGFKQQILAEGTVLLKNAYGTYNQGGDPDTVNWTDDIYDYPFCWKDRTAIGFKADGTPVVLVIHKSIHPDTYRNIGASYYEIGEQLKSLGCTNGFLLDGGGSSTFIARNANGGFDTVYSGEGTGRAVANAVILAVRDESVPLPETDTLVQGGGNSDDDNDGGNSGNGGENNDDNGGNNGNNDTSVGGGSSNNTNDTVPDNGGANKPNNNDNNNKDEGDTELSTESDTGTEPTPMDPADCDGKKSGCGASLTAPVLLTAAVAAVFVGKPKRKE